MRLVFAGTPEPAVVALEKLLASDHEIVAVLTRPDAKQGRGRSLKASPVAQLARQHNIEVLTPTSLKPDTEDGQLIRQRLRELAPDCIPVVAYGNLITPDLLDVAPHGWVNLHFSLLPAWRGAAPVQAAIRAGDHRTGASVFRIAEGLDTGDVLATVTEDIAPSDTADDLLTRLAYVGGDLLVHTMDGLQAGTVVATPQVGDATYAPKIRKEDARVAWAQPAETIERAIRAHTPGPGAWTQAGEQRFKLGPVALTDGEDLAPGALRVTRGGVLVGTGTQAVRLSWVQPPGKTKMQADAWARGAKDIEGMVWQ